MSGTGDEAFRGPLAAAFGSRFVHPADSGGPGFAAVLAEVLAAPASALPVPPATDRTVWGPAGRADAATVSAVVARAESDLGTPWPVPLASQAARVHRDGDREAWEAVAFERQRRLSRAAVAAASTLDDAWADEVADGVQLLCEQSSWCWPAHDDTFRAHGSVLATVSDPFVDLGAGEVVGQLAWLDHLLGAQLDDRYPGLRERIRHEARGRIFEPFLGRRDWHWIGLDGDPHNWNPWIHGNILVAALRLLDGPADGERRSRVIALAVEGIDRYVAALPADGAIDEGYAYWWNGACRALEALDILAHATGGRLDAAAAIPALRETVAFPHRMHLGGEWYLNLADGPARPPADQPWHSLHRAARRAGDPAAEAHAAAHRVEGAPVATEAEGLGRLLRGMTDEAWLAASAQPSPLPRDVWLPSTQVMLARARGGSSAGLTVAAKGGHNGENHNHNDIGSFVVASDGVPVLVDAGRPTYTAATFGPERYSIWTMQSSWHSLPEVRGAAQAAGAQFRAADVAYGVTDDGAELSLDLAPAYPSTGLRAWRRTVRLDRGAPRVTIEDAWRLDPWRGDGEEPPTTVRILVAGSVRLGEGAARIAPLEGATPVVVRWPSGVAATVTERELDDPMLSTVWGDRLTRLELLVSHRDGLTVTVERDPSGGEDHR
ncbi:MAG TPA: heparinase II/III family protein [Microbacterium sp.]|nr:heparinase II/III family protein [Microbacterium sp.]